MNELEPIKTAVRGKLKVPPKAQKQLACARKHEDAGLPRIANMLKAKAIMQICNGAAVPVWKDATGHFVQVESIQDRPSPDFFDDSFRATIYPLESYFGTPFPNKILSKLLSLVDNPEYCNLRIVDLGRRKCGDPLLVYKIPGYKLYVELARWE